MSKAMVVRYGAWGDHIMATPLYRLLKKDGYHVIANVNKRGLDVIKNNPYIDEVELHEDNSVPFDQLAEYWKEKEGRVDKFINLTGSIEHGLLKTQYDPEYSWPHKDRHAVCNVNYYDRTLELGGFPHRGFNGELFFDDKEMKVAVNRMKKYKDKFVIMWSLSGSGLHKIYPWTDTVIDFILKRNPQVEFITVGDELCRLIEPEVPHVFNACGKWSMRTTLSLTKVVDLVIGTETGVMNAAGCFDTPKIVMLSHSSHENLSKYWKNCIPLAAPVQCQPCHQMHNLKEGCTLHPELKTPVCMSAIPAGRIAMAIESFIRRKNNGGTHTAN